MCFKTPKPPAVQTPPRRDETASAVADTRRRTREQQGVYGNIFTSVLGDTGYGQNAQKLARLGGV